MAYTKSGYIIVTQKKIKAPSNYADRYEETLNVADANGLFIVATKTGDSANNRLYYIGKGERTATSTIKGYDENGKELSSTTRTYSSNNFHIGSKNYEVSYLSGTAFYSGKITTAGGYEFLYNIKTNIPIFDSKDLTSIDALVLTKVYSTEEENTWFFYSYLL